ncbi:nickel-dependent lactate racemase family protein [Natronospora cellulosivora (SeqCode)]
MEKIKLEYGDKHLEFDFPFKYKLLETGSTGREIIDWEEKIRESFSNPIESPTLSEIVEKDKIQKVLILVNDITRPLNYDIVLQPMLDELEDAGIDSNNITLLIATGMHRAMTAEEVEKMLGQGIAKKYKWVNHDCEAKLEDYGSLSHDVPLYLNSLVKETDLLCAVGVVAPHYMAGFSGGRKSLLPGVCGRETIEAHHSLMRLPGSKTANLEGNPFHQVTIEAAKIANLRFISNLVVDSQNEPVDLVVGDWLKAWEKGVEICKKASVIELEEAADIVIVSAGGFPKDINMYQAQKALENASYAVKDGGLIFLLAECREGLGEDVFEDWLEEASDPEYLEERIEQEFKLGGHKAFAIARVAKNHSLYLYSSLSAEITKNAFMDKIENIEDFISNKIEDDSIIYIIPHGANTVPYLK